MAVMTATFREVLDTTVVRVSSCVARAEKERGPQKEKGSDARIRRGARRDVCGDACCTMHMVSRHAGRRHARASRVVYELPSPWLKENRS